MPAANASSRLVARAFDPLPLGQVRPAGWLAGQLRLQAEGLSGHLDEFWPDVAESGWIGGAAEGWERGPYWLDGIVPLAFLLDDPALLAKARRWVDAILARQSPDGWLGPTLDARYGYAHDPWPSFVALKALIQFQEATSDARIIPAMLRFCRRLAAELDTTPLRSWGQMRWADLVLSVHWLHERTGDDQLLDLAAKLRAQGFDWGEHYADFPFRTKATREECTLHNHVVNQAMGLKAPAVWSRQSGDAADRVLGRQGIAVLDQYHGQANGTFSGDEHLAGQDPSQGTELCAVVEYMYSLEQLVAILGDAVLADRLEWLAYNALPATFSPDMWAHQYVQQVNQVVCRVAEDRVYTDNGPDANIFGLAPHFGCCTANLSQGWPKFAAHLWMRAADGGPAAIAYAPCQVATTVGDVPVRIEVVTEYPFAEVVRIVVRPERPVAFALHLRVPAWAGGATIRIGDASPLAPEADAFARLEHNWVGETVVTLTLPMAARVERRPRGAVAVARGPLLYALPLGEDWRFLRGEHPHADWEVYPTTSWNYALALDPARPDAALHFTARAVGARPFSPDGAPVLLRARGYRVPAWQLAHNAAAPPESPALDGPAEDLTLIPYGATNLRVAEFPLARG